MEPRKWKSYIPKYNQTNETPTLYQEQHDKESLNLGELAIHLFLA